MQDQRTLVPNLLQVTDRSPPKNSLMLHSKIYISNLTKVPHQSQLVHNSQLDKISKPQQYFCLGLDLPTLDLECLQVLTLEKKSYFKERLTIFQSLQCRPKVLLPPSLNVTFPEHCGANYVKDRNSIFCNKSHISQMTPKKNWNLNYVKNQP